MNKKYDNNQTKAYIRAIAEIDPVSVRRALINNADPSPLFKITNRVWTAQLFVSADEVQAHNACSQIDKASGFLADLLPVDDMKSVKWLGLAGFTPISSADANVVRVGPDSYTNAVSAALFDMFASIVVSQPDNYSDAKIEEIARARDVLQVCMDFNANIAGSDARGMTLLHWCCALYDDQELIARLVKWGCNADTPDHAGVTPIEVAAQHGHVNSFAGLGVEQVEKTKPVELADIASCQDEPVIPQEVPCELTQPPQSMLRRYINVLLGRTSPLDNTQH